MSRLEQVWGQERFVASSYDWGVQHAIVGRVMGELMWGYDIRRLLASIDRLASEARGTRVLDVPCGGGLAFRALKPGHGLAYTALDYSPVMLKRAQQRATALGLADLAFQQGDVGALPFADESFDLVLTYNGLHCFPDVPRAVAELGRVTSKGGRLRGTACIRGEGARYDALQALFRQLGFFGPSCTAAELSHLLTCSGFEVKMLETCGALVQIEAVRRQ
jgi:SAM-dependent methyltransferase